MESALLLASSIAQNHLPDLHSVLITTPLPKPLAGEALAVSGGDSC